MFVGYRNLNKVIAPRVIPMAKRVIIVPRRTHPWTIRPRQWHITKGDHTIEKEFRKRISPDMTERMVDATKFNASHQTS